MKETDSRGFALLAVVVVLMLLAVAAIALGRRAAMRSRMALNRVINMQTYFGAKSAIEYTKWKLDSDPTWGRGVLGETFALDGFSYNVHVSAFTNAVLPGFDDPILIICRRVGSMQTMTAVTDTLRPRDFYIADMDNDRIRKVDGYTWTISTVAGTGSAGYSGDNGPAVAAKIKTPGCIWLDPRTNMFIADTGNHRIRTVSSASGIITTIAGTGSSGYSGDGGIATNAKVSAPSGVCTDSQGNVIIADTVNDRIRVIDAVTGIIRTVAGTGSAGYSADGVAATNAKINAPGAVYLDLEGNIIIADTGNSRIRKVTVSTGIITTIAGTGTAGYSGDGGAATNAKINKPWGVSVDPRKGDIYIADTGNSRVRKVSAETGIITTVAGTGTSGFSGDGGPATNAKLNKPYDARMSLSGVMYIADSANNRIRKVDIRGRITTAAGMSGAGGFTGDGVNATMTKLDTPYSVSPDPN